MKQTGLILYIFYFIIAIGIAFGIIKKITVYYQNIENFTKIELTDYIELPISEFINTTKLELYPSEKNSNLYEGYQGQLKIVCDNQYITSVYLEEKSNSKHSIANIFLNGLTVGMKYESAKLPNYKQEESNSIAEFSSIELNKKGIMLLKVGHLDNIAFLYGEINPTLKELLKNTNYVWNEDIIKRKLDSKKEDIYISYPIFSFGSNQILNDNINDSILIPIKDMIASAKSNKPFPAQVKYKITYESANYISGYYEGYFLDNNIKKTIFKGFTISLENGELMELSEFSINKEDLLVHKDGLNSCYNTEEFILNYKNHYHDYYIQPNIINLIFPRYREISNEEEFPFVVSQYWWNVETKTESNDIY